MRKRIEHAEVEETTVVSEPSEGSAMSLEDRVEALEVIVARYGQVVSQVEREFSEFKRLYQDMKTTIDNLTPWVMQGRLRGEALTAYQSLDQRISVIERYLKMITAQ